MQSITVIGGTSGGRLTGLVPVPLDNASPPGFVNNLQALLGSNISGTGYSDSVNAGALYLNNLNIVGQTGAVVFGANNSGVPGILELTNTDSMGSVHSGSANISGFVPLNYSTFIVQAPGTETVSGNGSSNQLDIFGANSSVNFNTGGGSGTVVAGGGGNFIVVAGSTWSVDGSTDGNDTINSNASNGLIYTYGQGNAVNNAVGVSTVPSNVVGLAGAQATVNSYGTNDLIETYSGNDTILVNNSANVLINGGAATVYATASSTAVKSFFNLGGGTLDFINQSSNVATVSGNVPGSTGGSATVFGGSGGGNYTGGVGGNNLLVGQSGSVTLTAAGTNNVLSVNGSYSGFSNQNVLVAGSGSDTLVASATTNYNAFYGGTGSDSIVSFGSGQQTFVVGATGSESMTGSTVTGASNLYIFQQDANSGGSDIITNFNFNTDNIYINFFGGSGVSVAGIGQLFGAHSGSIVYLSNNTTIQLYGVTNAQLNAASIIGGTHI